MVQIFSDDAGKKCDKCIQMHYIGKSYVTTVYKCDDGKQSDDSEKKVSQVYTMHYIGKSYETTVYKCELTASWDKNFLMILKKKAWQVYKGII